MTYCIGMMLAEGLVMLADTRTNAGVDNISSYRKLHLFETMPGRVFAVASAGSLSTTQTALAALRDGIVDPVTGMHATLADVQTMHAAAQLVGHALRQTRQAMREQFAAPGINFDASLLLGGRIGDGPLELFLIYSAGNAIECAPDTPFLQIGELKYGKPILDRALRHTTSIDEAIKIALLSFDATVRSNLAVGPPLDLAVIRGRDTAFSLKHRIEPDDAYWRDLNERWGEALEAARLAIPDPPYVSDVAG